MLGAVWPRVLEVLDRLVDRGDRLLVAPSLDSASPWNASPKMMPTSMGILRAHSVADFAISSAASGGSPCARWARAMYSSARTSW